MPTVLDIEQALLLLELEPPFDKRDVQLARRRQAKVWHPDLAPPGKQIAHERHLKAINEAADQLERIAETSRGGTVTRNAVKVSAAAARRRARRGGPPRLRGGAAPRGRRRRSRRTRPVRLARARPLGRPSLRALPVATRSGASATVSGIYFTGGGDDIQQWARVRFQPGVRTVPADSLQFVDFSKPDPGAERVQRFVTAAQHAMAEGDFELAARRLIYARDADPRNAVVLRLMTLAFWQAGDLPAAGRAVRDWARVENDRPAPHRFAARIYEDMGALALAEEAARARRRPRPAGRRRLGAGRPAAPAADGPRGRARGARARAPARARASTACSTSRSCCTCRGTSAARSPPASRRRCSTRSRPTAWARYAHALARTDRVSDAIAACEHALALDPDERRGHRPAHAPARSVPRVLPAA